MKCRKRVNAIKHCSSVKPEVANMEITINFTNGEVNHIVIPSFTFYQTQKRIIEEPEDNGKDALAKALAGCICAAAVPDEDEDEDCRCGACDACDEDDEDDYTDEIEELMDRLNKLAGNVIAKEKAKNAAGE